MAYCPPTTDDQERDNLIETYLKILRKNNADFRDTSLRKLLQDISTEKLINTVHDLDGGLCGICHVGQMVWKGKKEVCNACGEDA